MSALEMSLFYGIALYKLCKSTNSAFHSFGVGKWVAIRVITWITSVATIKRHTRAAYGC